jgi:hypothetical protein
MAKGPSQFPGVRDDALALMCQVGNTNESLLLNEVVKVLSRYDPFPLIVAVPAMIMLTKIGIVSVHQASPLKSDDHSYHQTHKDQSTWPTHGLFIVSEKTFTPSLHTVLGNTVIITLRPPRPTQAASSQCHSKMTLVRSG